MIDFLNIQIINFDRVTLLLFVICLFSLLISIFFGIKRLNNSSAARKLLLIVFNCFALIALTGLLFKPHLKGSSTESVSLITQGNFVRETQLNDLKYTLSNTSDSKKIISLNYLSNVQQLLYHHPNLQTLQVLGDGLSENQWKNFGNIQVDYVQPKKLSGIVDIEWQRELNQGELLIIKGRLQFIAKDKVFHLRLINPANEVEQEQQLLGNEIFTLNTQPKTSGLHQYKIEVFNSNKQLVTEETVSINVTNNAQVKILILQSSPSFETKQLQNWAAEHGGKILTKTKISQDRYITQSINIEHSYQTNNIEQLFDQFDLLMIDGRGLTELTNHQKEILEKETRNGLGVLILADSALLQAGTKSALLTGFSLQTFNEDNASSLEVTPNWLSQSVKKDVVSELLVSRLNAKLSINEKQLIGFNLLVWSKDNHLLVAKKQLGNGQLALSTVRDTYRWVTSGNKALHSDYWQNLIKNIARYQMKAGFLPPKDKSFYRVNQLAELCLLSDEPIMQVSAKNKSRHVAEQILLMQQDLANQKQYCGYFWPRQPGWYHIAAKDEKYQSWIYVESLTSWSAIQQQEKIRATLAKQASYIPEQLTDVLATYKPISSWYFWWLFLISATVLWLERKFD
ncbi:hypothetical protein [Aliikangiella sp. IMCC44359]|uniref:hypothetical protein n=1 Tax=Aliikangiella sp. IMCC44359 TaxID=3459125 RepID=UPI00403B1D80